MNISVLASAALAAMLLCGCNTHSVTGPTTIEGLTVTVVHPSGGKVTCNSSPIVNDKQEPQGTRYTHDWDDGLGKKKQQIVVEIVDSKLKINDQSFGTVAKGDAVKISGDAITVNGQPRQPDKK